MIRKWYNNMERFQEIERSIIKKFRQPLWKKFINGVNDYQLIQEGDKIAVCISGGKDSMLLAKLMQEVQRHGKIPFELEFLVMNPGYNEINKQTIINNAKLLDIPITMFETQIFDIVAVADGSPCYLCARMRRGYLYKEAQALGCNKIALGHHFDDVIETVLMGMLYAGQIQTMMPKLHSTNHPGMQLIRPMYLVKEADILDWKQYNDLQFIQCACRFTENCTLCDNGGGGSKRQEMKALVKKFRQTNPSIDQNIFRSIHDVNLSTIIGYHDKEKEYNFLDDFDQKGGTVC
jgi:tRNA 2-thiocytidine biosynthesis protein TtcA